MTKDLLDDKKLCEEIIDCYVNNKIKLTSSVHNSYTSLGDVATFFNISRKIVTRVLNENNIKIRNSSFMSQTIISDELEKEIVAFYNDCKHLRRTKKKFNLSEETIKKILTDNLITIRTKREFLVERNAAKIKSSGLN